jgi:DNA ligase-associated metallophosphoesterase
MNPAPVVLCGETLLLDPSGALFWPRLSVLAVADLHLEKGSACAGAGRLVPPWDSRQTLQRLASVIGRFRPRMVLAVGDSFHDASAAGRLAGEDAALIASLSGLTSLVWLSGNHDPAPPRGLGGSAAASWREASLVFRHQADASGCTGEISGHFHPKARIATRAGDIVRPCFVRDGNRILLPAFGAYTGGLDIASPAIAALFPDGGQVFALGRERLFTFAFQGKPRPRAAPALAATPEPHNFL